MRVKFAAFGCHPRLVESSDDGAPQFDRLMHACPQSKPQHARRTERRKHPQAAINDRERRTLDALSEPLDESCDLRSSTSPRNSSVKCM